MLEGLQVKGGENLVEIEYEQIAECIAGSTMCDTNIDTAAMFSNW